MKLNTGSVIKKLNGTPVLTDQEVIGNQVSGGRNLTVGDVLTTILTTKKVEQFSALKAYALSQRMYRSEFVDLDDSDYRDLREVVEKNDQFIPLVLAQVMQALIDARDPETESPKKPKR